jgi:hypothetical protein
VSEHHLIDPATDRPAAETIELASAVAAEGWLAEVWAKALLLRPRSGLRDLERDGLSGLVIDRNGRFEASGGLAAYLGASLLGVTPMASVSREHESCRVGRRDGQAAIELDESVSTRISLVQPPGQAPRP